MTIHTPTGVDGDRDRDRDRGLSGDGLTDPVAIDGSVLPTAVSRVLDNGRRRAILRCLVDADGPLPVRQVVARIADAEHDPTTVTSLHDCRQRVHVSLRRTHLPLLERHRILSYDRDAGLVAPGARLAAFASALEEMLELE